MVNMERLEILKQHPSTWEWPRIAVFVPLERTISYASHVLPWIVRTAREAPRWIFSNYSPTDVGRNKAADALLDTDSTHILMLDLDHVHPPDIIQRLGRWVINDPEIQVVGGLNFRRGEPFYPCAFIEMEGGQWGHPDQWDPGLMRVDVLGTGCILIAREVFETIGRPYFYYPYDRAAEGEYLSEDVGFSNKCREHGIKLYMDTTTTSPHIGDMLIDEQTYRVNASKNGSPVFKVTEDGDYERVH